MEQWAEAKPAKRNVVSLGTVCTDTGRPSAKKDRRNCRFWLIFELVEESYCLSFGRPANEPKVLFRLLFLQYLDKLSDERVVSEAQVNLAYKWFLGLNPEDLIPDGLQLSRFRTWE